VELELRVPHRQIMRENFWLDGAGIVAPLGAAS
jgi:hypothetical protein